MVSLDSPGAIGRRGRVAIGVAAAAYLGATILPLVYGSVHWPVAPAVVVGHSVGMFMAATVTALLLLAQAGVTGRRAYAILGATYLFVALVMLVFPLTFPGAFRSPDPLTGDPRSILGGGQSAIWLFYLWQSSFFVGILIGALVYWRDNATLRRPGLRWGVRRIIWVTSLAAAIPIGVIVLAPAVLPVILDPNTGKSPLLVGIDVCLVVLGLAVCAVTLLQARRGSVMNLFLAAVGLTALGMVLSELTARERWTVGWYSTRVFTLVSMAALMVLLILALSKVDRVSTRYAEQDTLTGLLRRRTFDSRLRFE